MRPMCVRRLRRDDDGASLIMAIIMMMVLTTLSVAVLGRTLTAMTFAKNGQDYDAALSAADAGLADALQWIDQGAATHVHGFGSSGTAVSCAAGGPPTASKPATPACPWFDYYAIRVTAAKYKVTSVGQVGIAKRGIEALVERSPQFPYVLFSDQELRFSATQQAGAHIDFYSFNRLLGQADNVRVGSNTTVKCEAPPDPNITIDWFLSSSGCGTTNVNKLPKAVDVRMNVPKPSATDLPCPLDGTFGVPGNQPIGFDPASPAETTLAQPQYIAAGVYLCDRDVALRGLVVPAGGTVKIYVLPKPNGTASSLNIASAVVNPNGSASNFQIYKEGSVPMVFTQNTSNNLTYRGVIFAPKTPVTFNSGLWWAGSITASQLNVNGSPDVKIGYDFDLAQYLGIDWHVTRYREAPSSNAPTALPTTTTPPTTTSTTSTTLLPTTTSVVPPTLPPTTTSTSTTSTTTTTLLPPTTLPPTTLPPTTLPPTTLPPTTLPPTTLPHVGP